MPAKLLWERIPQVPSCFPSSVMPPRSIRLSSVRGKKIGEILHMAVASPTCMLRSYQSGTRAALIPYAFGWRLYLWTCTSIYLPHLPQQRPSHSSAGSILSVTFHLRFRSAIPELVVRSPGTEVRGCQARVWQPRDVIYPPFPLGKTPELDACFFCLAQARIPTPPVSSCCREP